MEKPTLKTLSERFVWARKEAGYSQVRLADALGISQGSVEKLENGKVVKPKYLPEAAKLLGVSYEWLLSGKGESSKLRQLSDVISETRAKFEDDAFISPLLQSLEAAVKQKENEK